MKPFAPDIYHWTGATPRSVVIIDAAAYYAAFYQAAMRARRHIVLAGWQFDSSVQLLRGEAAATAPHPTQLLPFLNALGRVRPELKIYVLAWDYSLVYSLEREWLQGLRFAFQSSGAIRFEFDSHPHFGGSHHQKLVVVDGALAFVGGLDICEERWDDRKHSAVHPLRVNAAGEASRPNHEVQAAVFGEAAAAVLALFRQRWQSALGAELALDPDPRSEVSELDLRSVDEDAILPLRAREVALARTAPAPTGPAVQEVSEAIRSALGAAERMIYIETQYFTSRSVTAEILNRLRDRRLPRLQVLILMPRGADNSKEKFALGDLQSAMLADLEIAAEQHGHDLVFLCSAVAGENCEQATFIHSKVLIVDDELLCVGSANMTERSMSLDSELCLFWQAQPESELSSDIREVRASLLAEHSGLPSREFASIHGLVNRVRAAIENGTSRLRSCHFDPVSVNLLKQAMFDPPGPAAPFDP